MTQNIKYRIAGEGEIDEIIVLLQRNELPTSDIKNDIDFIVAVDGNDQIAGCIGIEKFGPDGLLRSFAVNEGHRNQKIGGALYNRLLSFSKQSGIQTLHLLTTTAEKYFSGKGFLTSKRDEAPASIKATTEFTSICPSSSAYMSLAIDSAALSYYNDIQKLQKDTQTQSSFWSISGTNLQFTSFDVPANTVFEKHQHDSEQITYVLEGELFFEIHGVVHQLRKGDSIFIPGSKEHKVWTNSFPVKAVDAWSPANKKYNSQNQ